MGRSGRDKGGSGYRGALESPDYRRLLIAMTVSVSGSWAYNVALVAVIFKLTGSPTWVAAVTLAKFIPSMLFSPYAGVLADRFERRNLMFVLDLAMAGMQVLLAIAAIAGSPALVILTLASLSSLMITVYEPAVAATIPATVDEQHLAAANALKETIYNLAVIVGPAIGAVLLWQGSSAVVFLANAATFVVSAFTVRTMTTRSTPVDVTEGGQAGLRKQLSVGMRAMFSSRLATLLVAYSIVATFMYGTDTVLFLAISEKMGTGAEGYGYLLAGLGVGGIIGATMVNRLAARPRLGLIITVGMAVYCLPTAFTVLVDDPAIAFVLQAIRGAGTLVVDTLAIVALQRSLRQDILARVFGAFFTLMLAAIALGAMIAAPLLDAVGTDTTLLLAGVVVPVAALLAYPWLRRSDAEAVANLARLAPAIAAIEASALFDDAPRIHVEALAKASSPVDVAAGTAFIRQGERADALYLILDGTVAVHHGPTRNQTNTLATLGAGDHVGEIGLIEHVPRTASVTAVGPVSLLRIDGEAFADVLSSGTPSAAFLEGSRQRMRNRPSATPQMFDPTGGRA